jgi:hypothetical protein
MEFLYPWVALRNPKDIDDQLAREIPPGHVLIGVPVQALAQMDGSDDFLYQLLDGTGRMAVVHLTYTENVSAQWPWTEFFASYTEWATTRMKSDGDGIQA